ncbi:MULTISPECIES: peroxynitrite isomerase [Mycobacteriaceae]|uniref:Peroxynitrite isomerase n=1 Tax=Mycolicibacterium neoaurum VKM Ac-1815D TaxID=700508 RepID=V5X603_MYCNE|nr:MULTISPECIES: FABP family protein [Mycobacteriaceae]AHC23243.1 fatty acid-binding-like protein [Mycolicibacterium neoaurum VKM Ac-1815D]AMO03993.1 fatty acid-binding-like protein [Mycolicibacterium neoaurum]AXK77747.1 FABP family protein [Mycolicibacterium neoaurum]KJQ49788.1 fatty acid-binding-like protein [Mycolicibacterium neoaurum]KUM07564.1 fatty acid-binding-like protein [Mycolicibacterium neoaurum]
MVDLHPAMTVLEPLLGIWAGPGAGEYPTIPSFEYQESITFGHVGKPFLSYNQHTRSRADGRPLHAETGYIRIPEPGRVEWVLAHPTGIVEVMEGPLQIGDDGALTMTMTSTIGRSSSAKDVSAMARTFTLRGEELSYTVQMAAVGQPLQHHLSAVLRKDAP